MKIREYCQDDLEEMIDIWNDIVEEGISFPQEDMLDLQSGREFFSSQTYVGVAISNEHVVGLYILHPNNVGRCGHIANASYAVSSNMRGKHIGEKLVLDSMEIAKSKGFLILQYNAVVETNYAARHLYEKLGFRQLGTVPKGFRAKDNTFKDICPYYIEL